MDQHAITITLGALGAVCLLIGMNPDKHWALAAVVFAILAVAAHFTGIQPEHLAVLAK